MRKLTAKEMKSDFYDIGDGCVMMNVKTMKDGKLDRVDTYIGKQDICMSGLVYGQVASVKGLSEPGVIFRYSDHVHFLEAHMDLLTAMYLDNMRHKM